jgi:Flp pilus assembly protein CpaB
MSRRGRAAAFAILALITAALAATIADGYGSRIARSYGPLRPVVVAGAALPAGKPIGPRALEAALEVRRVPTRFVPPGTLMRPRDALGLEPGTDVLPGSYVSTSVLRSPRTRGHSGPPLGAGRRPVQIAVAGGGAPAIGIGGPGARVDVVVTTEPSGPGPGRTYVAAPGVPLLALEPAGADPAAGAMATLGLTREQALALISAQTFARQVTLLPRAGG